MTDGFRYEPTRQERLKMHHRARILIGEEHTLVAELFKGVLTTEFEIVGIMGMGLP